MHISTSGPKPPSAQQSVALLLLVMCIQYFLGTVFFPQIPIITAIWVLLLLVTLFLVKPFSITVTLIFYSILLLFYTTGIIFDNLQIASFEYSKNIASSFIFSALMYGMISHQIKSTKGWFLSQHHAIFIQRAVMIAIFLWSFFALRTLNDGIVIDFRDITGTGYLTLSDSFAAFSIAYLCRDRLPSWEFAVVLGMSITVIILLGSRSTLALYPLSVPFMIGRRVSFNHAVIWVALVGGIAIYVLKDKIDLESGALFRFYSLMSLKGDESASVRDIFVEQMFDRMNSHPECFIISCHPERGSYAHNALSFVQYFGLAGMALIFGSVALIFTRFKYLFKQWYFPLFLYCLFGLLLSRAWLAVLFPMFVAMILDTLFAGRTRPRTLSLKTG